VEGLVGYARRNFMVPIPRVSSWEELNAYLESACRERRLRGHTETIGERFERDRATMLPLPATPYETCEKISARVSSLSLIRYRGNDYSVPTEYGHRQVCVKGYVHGVVIACASEVIARHQRSYEREAVVFDPLHYLALLEQKTRALDQAAPLVGWRLPACFAELRRLLETRLKKNGSREYVQVLRVPLVDWHFLYPEWTGEVCGDEDREQSAIVFQKETPPRRVRSTSRILPLGSQVVHHKRVTQVRTNRGGKVKKLSMLYILKIGGTIFPQICRIWPSF